MNRGMIFKINRNILLFEPLQKIAQAFKFRKFLSNL